MQDPDYALYMDTQQAINLEILHQFEREGIRFAYPTQTLRVQTVTSPAAPSDEQPASSPFFSQTEPVIQIRTKRASDRPASSDGTRILVDGYWPPGVKKEDAAIDLWLKKIAPSSRLRSWFGHDPEKWVEFQQRYADELDRKPAAVNKLLELARAGTITLVYGAHNTKINTAAALGKYIRKHIKKH
jgi:uncharacterized protein YeaO (DUF488 family)